MSCNDIAKGSKGAGAAGAGVAAAGPAGLPEEEPPPPTLTLDDEDEEAGLGLRLANAGRPLPVGGPSGLVPRLEDTTGTVLTIVAAVVEGPFAPAVGSLPSDLSALTLMVGTGVKSLCFFRASGDANQVSQPEMLVFRPTPFEQGQTGRTV